MPERLSAIDAISPAFEHTRRRLLEPFQFRKWARLAVITLLSGELGGGGGGGGGNFRLPAEPSKEDFLHSFLQSSARDRVMEFLPWILAGAAAVLALILIFLFIHSIFRFVLFDAVLFDRYRLREGWGRWQTQGASFFRWQLCLLFVFLVGAAVLVGGPLYYAWQAGLLRDIQRNFGAIFGGGLLIFFVFAGFIIVLAIIALLAKDFVVPVMALENIGVLEGWRRAFSLLGPEKLSVTGYVLMKILLAIAAGILFGIIGVIVLLILLTPLVLVGVVVGVAAAAAGLTWNAFTITAVVLVGLVGLAGLLFVMGFIYVPSAVFFQAYTLHYYGSRYVKLGELLAPPSAPAEATSS